MSEKNNALRHTFVFEFQYEGGFFERLQQALRGIPNTLMISHYPGHSRVCLTCYCPGKLAECSYILGILTAQWLLSKQGRKAGGGARDADCNEAVRQRAMPDTYTLVEELILKQIPTPPIFAFLPQDRRPPL